MAKINGKNIPHDDYPAGSYWTDNGESNGTGLTFDNAESCMGFTMYIYAYLYGSSTAGNTISKRTCKGSSSDFNNINAGARMNCTGPYGNHSMILVSKSSTGVTVYDCNWREYGTSINCVDLRTYTFAAFKNKFSSINSGYTK